MAKNLIHRNTSTNDSPTTAINRLKPADSNQNSFLNDSVKALKGASKSWFQSAVERAECKRLKNKVIEEAKRAKEAELENEKQEAELKIECTYQIEDEIQRGQRHL